MANGKFIVIDGTDGSGKATQIELLTQALKKQKLKFETIDFPRYEENIYGRLAGRYLKGEFGGVNEVSPYLAALTYAGDRNLAKILIEKWLTEGKVVISNRYVPSSKAHMAAKLKPKDRDNFWQWLDELEYKTNKIPKENFVIFLYVDPQVAQKNVDAKSKRGYVGGKKRDIHEANIEHLIKSSKLYLKQAIQNKNWHVIYCMKQGQLRSREDIQQEIQVILKTKGII